MQELQRSGFCCGLGPPEFCIVRVIFRHFKPPKKFKNSFQNQTNTNVYPSQYTSDNTFLSAPDIRVCSSRQVRLQLYGGFSLNGNSKFHQNNAGNFYYPATPICDNDNKCSYDLPIGTCSISPVQQVSNGYVFSLFFILKLSKNKLQVC